MPKVLEYTTEIQKLFLEMMMHDAQNYVRVQNIFNAENFTQNLRPVAEFMHKHAQKYHTLPERKQVKAMTGYALEELPDSINDGHTDWFLEEFEAFTKQKELERAIMKCADLLEKGDFSPVEKLIKDAVQISLTKDMGTDYFADPKGRLSAIKDNNGQVSTGWPSMDQKLYGGFNRGELQIFAGGSGSGKSLFMQNLAVNWVGAGLNGVFITLELSEGLCSMRIDSMLTSLPSRSIFKNIDDVDLKVRVASKKSGKFRIKYLPAQSTVNDIRAYIRELEIQHTIKVDFMCVDYLDLLMPVTAKVSPNDLFVKDKYVSEELRNLAKELNVIMVTASQLNRSAVEEIEFDHSHISGGISKINTADNVFGIFTSRAMRERGKYQLQLMKTRSSAGVGQKIDLDFDVDTLRIVDPGLPSGDESSPNTGANISSNIMNSIKTRSTVRTEDDEEVGNVKADVKSAKLKKLLGNLQD
jgi:KaiC/GvpD/RAD55 family RecA-like ATPase